MLAPTKVRSIVQMPRYDTIELEGQGLIKAEKDGILDVYDYYKT